MEYTSNASTYAGTVSGEHDGGRQSGILPKKRPKSAIFGLGYGFPLHSLVPYLRNTDIRTPHNVFYLRSATADGWV